jgi:hypothetical protein
LLAPYTLEKSTLKRTASTCPSRWTIPRGGQSDCGRPHGLPHGVTGLDLPARPLHEGETAGESHIELLYHFAVGGAVITLRVKVPYSNPWCQHLGLIPSVTLAERENMEMFGVTFEGTPNTTNSCCPKTGRMAFIRCVNRLPVFVSPQA